MADLGIAFDPGKTTGIAVCQFNAEGKFDGWVEVDQVNINDMPDWFVKFNERHEKDKLRVVVYEKFITYRQYAQRQVGSTQPASQVIGMVKMFASGKGLSTKTNSLVEQPADVLKVGYRWMDERQPSDHSKSHMPDARAHMYYWMVQKNKAEPKVKSFKEMFGGNQ